MKQFLFYCTYLLFLSFFILACDNKVEKENYSTINNIPSKYIDGYVDANNCTTCHKKETDLWKNSHHDLAMQIANDSTVLGDFNDFKTTIDGVKYAFFKKENNFFVKTNEIDGSMNTYQIAYTFGITPLQQYLIDFDKGKKQVLRVTWDVINKKWHHQYPGDKITTHDWLHWTKTAQNWNTMCAECHSTNLKKNYFIEKDSFNTTYSSVNVSCESCHGPAQKHVDWANSNSDKENNKYILKGNSQLDQLNLCAPCHSRRAKLTKNLEPGLKFEDQYMLQTLSNEYYHADGQIDEEDYVYGSFLQSKMYANGVKCSDCHNAHSLKLKLKGNQLCLQCHVTVNYDTPKHHFHKEDTEASQCINCHMTGKNYMGNDFRRDHSFRIPRPDQSVLYDTPNACIECHTDKTNAWAASSITNNYGKERKAHFSDNLLLSNKNNLTTSERSKLNKFINDLQYPSISRATAIANLNFHNNEQYEALLLALNDSSALVRYNALLKFRSLPLQDRVAIASKHINDSIKLVRIAAAQLLIGYDGSSLNVAENSDLQNANIELETMLYANADFSTGRIQLGDYYLQNNDIKTAIKHYNAALKKDSLLMPVYTNLASAYSMLGDNKNALKIIEAWIKLEPNNGRAFYLRALLYFEIKQNNKAVVDLKKAIDLNANDTRSMYNLATYYFQDKKDLNLAESYIKSALKITPNNQDYKYLLALIYRDQGKPELMQKIMTELKANQQG